MVDVAAENRSSYTLTVAQGASVSGILELRGMVPLSVITPAALEATTVKIQWWAGFDGSTPVLLTDPTGAPIVSICVVDASHFITLEWPVASSGGLEVFRGVNTIQLKLFATDGTTPVVQSTAARTFTLICERRPR